MRLGGLSIAKLVRRRDEVESLELWRMIKYDLARMRMPVVARSIIVVLMHVGRDVNRHGASLEEPVLAIAAGQATFARVCANCHKSGADMAPLALSSVVNGPDARNLIHIVRDGIRPPEASPNRSMPPFGNSLSPQDVENLVLFVRSHFSKGPAWTGVREEIAAAANEAH